MTPNPDAKTTVADLPFDVIRVICDQTTELYPAVPLDCSRGSRRNDFTGEIEERLELTSGAFYRIVQFLNANAAYRDMRNLSRTCKALHAHMLESMKSIHTVTQHRHPSSSTKSGSRT